MRQLEIGATAFVRDLSLQERAQHQMRQSLATMKGFVPESVRFHSERDPSRQAYVLSATALRDVSELEWLWLRAKQYGRGIWTRFMWHMPVGEYARWRHEQSKL